MANEAHETAERTKPETLRLKSISPSLTVNDIEESLRWYTEVIGFHLKERWEHEGELGGVELVAGDTHLMLTQDNWAKGRDRAKGEGFRLMFVASQPVDEIATSIKQRGGSLESEPEDVPWGGRAFSLVDPSGFKITVWGDA